MADDKKPAKSSRQRTEYAKRLVKVMRHNMAIEGNRGGGQRPLYDPMVHPKLAYEFCLLGLSQNRIAELLKVDPTTLSTWKREYPEFAQAILDGTEGASVAVAKALFSRATGYTHEDVHISSYQGDITETPIKKHYPPDVAAAQFWLKNRAPEAWKDRQEVDHRSGDGSMTPRKIVRVIVRKGETSAAQLDEDDDDVGEDG